MLERWNQEPYDVEANGLPEDLADLEWRRVEASGTWDYANQIVRTNTPGPNGEAGVMVVTPLVFESGEAILVARGWLPQELAAPELWPQTEEPEGEPVIGLINESETNGTATRTEDPRQWYSVDIPLLKEQMPYPLMPGLIKMLPEPGRTIDTYPTRELNLMLDEGSHLSYAIQWFMFALILGFGYSQYVRLQESRDRRLAQEQESGAEPDAPQADYTPLPAAEEMPHEPVGGRP